MKQTIFIFLFSALLANKAFVQTWHTQKLLRLGSANYPGVPEKSDTLGITLFQYFTDSSILVTKIQPLPDKNIDLNDQRTVIEFSAGVIEGIIESSNGKLVNKEYVSVDSIKGVRVEVTTNHPEMPDLIFCQFFAVADKVITQSYFVNSDMRDATSSQRTEFFNSLHFSDYAQKLNTIKQVENSSPFKLGYVIGQIAFPVIVVALIIYFIIRKRRKNGS